ncbi:MAG: hypothetical protein V1816_15185 [Pseudomonadota bacterium]
MKEEYLYLLIGVIALVVFAFQTVLTFLGGDGADHLGSMDHSDIGGSDFSQVDSHHGQLGHHDDDSGFGFLRFFTLRNLSAFTLGYGFAGYASLRTGFPSLAAAVVGLAAGSGFVWAMYKLMRVLNTLESDGTMDPRDAIGLAAEVYLEIEENSPGKITVRFGGVQREFPAVYPRPGRLERGTIVRIIDYDGNFFTVDRD